MFWKYNVISASHIETLLEKDNVTLRELMDEEDILQECKAQSQKLIDFLIRPESMDEMITLITQEPDEHLDEKTRYKYSNIACELLTFDVPSINEALSGDEALLNKLYSFLDTEKPLNPLLASFFSKTVGKMFSRKTDLMFDYLKSKPDFITLLLNHIETSAIMDLLVRLLTYSENTEMRTKVVNWLNEQSVVQRLVGLIDPAFSEDCHCNAAQALCDMIRASREQMSLLQEKADADPLLEAIESSDVVADLISHLFSGEKKESVFVNGIAVLLALLEFKKHGPASTQQVPPTQNQSTLQAENAPQTFASFFFRSDGPEQMTALDAERLAKGVNNVLDAVIPQIKDFHKLFFVPPPKQPMTLTIGCLDPPLGYTRLEVARFMVALIATNTHGVNCELANLRTIYIMMELFFKYSWNNFLHTQVEHAIGRILANAPTVDHVGNKVHPLLDQLLISYRITEKILDTFKEFEKELTDRKMVVRGYMGHLTKIANHIAQNSESGVNSDLIKKKLKELPSTHVEDWDKFVSGVLAETNKKNAAPLIGGLTLPSTSEDEDTVNFRGLPFTQESALQQVQQISSNFVDQFCFNEDFSETEDNLTGQLNRLAHVHFHLSDGNLLQRNIELFEQVCREKSYGINDLDSDEDIWEDKEDKSLCFRQRKESEDNSSDSEDETHVPSTTEAVPVINNEEVKMEIDNQDGWTANFDSVPMEVGTTSMQNPWETAEQPSSTSDEQENWADFSNFVPFGGTNPESSGEISSTTTAVAMETSDPSPNRKFVSSSEVSSTSDSTSELASNVPVKIVSEVGHAVGPICKESSPASNDSISSKESEAKVIVVNENDIQNLENPKESSMFHEKETCGSSTVQNGPV